ncbi:hypothetical protein PAHAL_9G303300 [Panicum hallii]|uniref:Uncharacterized protein n=1 Tax=Panicum hallii TaxID=206008 RepID=A0A2T8I311_9POAL|nr:hypothetical protein PAHAL_9G303300 [Panicum hallii]
MRIWFNHQSIDHLRPGSRAECSWISQTRKRCMLG